MERDKKLIEEEFRLLWLEEASYSHESLTSTFDELRLLA